MATGAALLGLLAFLLGCSGASAQRKCVLTGNWTNDLKSTMQISVDNDTGVFSGVYQTDVSDSTSTIRQSPLQGFQLWGARPVFGFTVKWSFAASVSVFAGQCFLDAEGKEQLKTTWLLRAEVGSRNDDWGATKVGTNTFYRTPVSG